VEEMKNIDFYFIDCGNNDKFAKEPDPSGGDKPLPEGFQS